MIAAGGPAWKRSVMLRRVCLLGFLVIGCGSTPDAATPEPAWHVSGGFVRAPDGRAAILRGANLAGANKSKPYFGFHQPADYQKLRDDWGMNSIRFLVIWAGIEPAKGEYDDAYLDQLAERIGWARDAGLHVVLDMHQDVYGEGFGGDGAPRWTCDESRYAAFKPHTQWFQNYLDPNVQACVDQFFSNDDLQSHYVEAWRRVAERLKDNDAVVGFDVINEPQWGSDTPGNFEADHLQALYEKVVPAVREIAPDWLAFLEPGANRNLGIPTGLVPFPFPDVVYSPHCYDAAAEQGMGFSAAGRGAIVSKIASLADEASALGAALWIGEYGGTTTSSGISEYMAANYDGAGAVAAANTYWAYDENSGGYGMLEDDGSEKAVLLDALARPVPELVAGDPIQWSFDATTRTFAFSWHPDPHVGAPTLLSVPAHAYPSGYSVTCDGCESTQSPGELTITKAPGGDPATLTITAK